MSKGFLIEDALVYHSQHPAGKLGIQVTKPMETPEDLTLAYSPGVAEPVREIQKNPELAYRYTSKGNLVAVITNGTAVLGLGNTGPLAAKPVMEGKAALFRRFADIDAIDIEVEASSPADFISTVANISPSFGGINLEDIKAPECFEIEHALKERLDIPVFHDDQHGTAITIAAGLLNALELQNKSIETAKIVCLGAGAAGLATMHLLTQLGARRDHIYLLDTQGVIHTKRTNLNPYKYAFAIETEKRTLSDAMEGADIFIGLSAPNMLSTHMVEVMEKNPIIFALSNPDPEIAPEIAHELRTDLIMATGRSDYPNQVNNLLVFPFIFRAALDVRATKITTEMQVAAVHAVRGLAKEPVLEKVKQAYSREGEELVFGPNYILPKPIDPRLIQVVPPAIAKAAIASGVARVDFCYE